MTFETPEGFGKVEWLWVGNTVVHLIKLCVYFPKSSTSHDLVFKVDSLLSGCPQCNVNSQFLMRAELNLWGFMFFGFIRKTHWQLERSKLHQHTSKHCYCAKLNSSDDFVPFFDTLSCSISTRRRTWQDSRESRCHWGSRSQWRVPSCLRSDRERQQGSPLHPFELCQR